MRLSTILKRNARYAESSGIVVDIDRSMGTVSLHDEIFMQGDDAEQFIAECDKLAKRCRSLDYRIIELAVAYPYCVLLEN